ncbi:hypothetical protein ECBD561099_2625 [Escherichia coli Bd5610_99]|nr:hypothetical protein ECFRIK523_5856 [Escherichia coli FRIK523]ERC67176.1 hypothetical protein ECBD561099_2625 [Escherichia coli Bd5610_99]
MEAFPPDKNIQAQQMLPSASYYLRATSSVHKMFQVRVSQAPDND